MILQSVKRIPDRYMKIYKNIVVDCGICHEIANGLVNRMIRQDKVADQLGVDAVSESLEPWLFLEIVGGPDGLLPGVLYSDKKAGGCL